ncbi:hypothetical protein [Cesiribacter sp. SM1]|uniref:hypothetical protein n=1 Tax=Cesiribacter sp. SM1 TaxID=2861196 RepID=UPI001CD5A86A|nr:hypothetical protein [Cesiribacter sp. SM1]
MQNWRIMIGFVLLMVLACPPAYSQNRYTHFPWTYDRNVSAGIGAEGTTFTFLGRVRPDTASIYSAFAIPVNPIRGAIGGYYNRHTTNGKHVTDFGLGYNIVLRFTETANLRLGVQRNWHQVTDVASASDIWDSKAPTTYNTTDFSALLRRDHLVTGVSMENALEKGNRQYNILLGFRELETYSWLRSSPFMMMQIREGREVPEFRFNYTVTVLNTLVMGSSVYKNSYYSWGANAGIKLFRSVWLAAGADFKEFNTQPDALELGLRFNFGRGRVRSAAEEAELPPVLSKEGLRY